MNLPLKAVFIKHGGNNIILGIFADVYRELNYSFHLALWESSVLVII